MRGIVTVGAAIVLGLIGCAPRGGNLEFLSPDDAKMNSAMAQARKTLPTFWTKVDAQDPAVSNPVIRVGLPNTHGSLEHIWMTVDSHSGLSVRGRLVNAPVDLPKLHIRDDVTVQTSQISDWAYTKAGKQFGYFTLRATIDRSTPDERRELGQGLAPTPLEPGDR